MNWLDQWKEKSIEAITLEAKSKHAAVEAEYAMSMHKAETFGGPKGGNGKPNGAPGQHAVSNGAITCDQCNAEIKDSARKDGSTWTAAEKAEYSRKQNGGRVLCYKCQR